MTRMVVTALVLTFVLVRPAVAQPGEESLRLTPDFDWVEIGVDFGIAPMLLGDDGSTRGLVGGRVTRNHTKWLAGEVALHHGYSNEQLGAFNQLAANARMGGWIDNRILVFGTAGVVAATGLSYRCSPLLGFGGEWIDGDGFGGRVEIQRFIRGWQDGDGLRLTVGFVIRP